MDFMRAAMRGLQDALDDPQAAADMALELINGNGNPNFLSPEGEVFRWKTEAEIIKATTAPGQPYGFPDPVSLQAEVDAYAAIGLFGEDTAPSIEGVANPLVGDVYADDDRTVIWPAQ
jgi:hypothetical protein